MSGVDCGRWYFLPRLEIEVEEQGLAGGKKLSLGHVQLEMIVGGAMQMSVGSSRRT